MAIFNYTWGTELPGIQGNYYENLDPSLAAIFVGLFADIYCFKKHRRIGNDTFNSGTSQIDTGFGKASSLASGNGQPVKKKNLVVNELTLVLVMPLRLRVVADSLLKNFFLW